MRYERRGPSDSVERDGGLLHAGAEAQGGQVDVDGRGQQDLRRQEGLGGVRIEADERGEDVGEGLFEGFARLFVGMEGVV